MQNSHVLPVVQAEVVMETSSVLWTLFFLKKSLDFCLSFNLVWADVVFVYILVFVVCHITAVHVIRWA
jgi:hypothetical protein